tara:strand:- start:1209 stop:1694 length:486 start_codon:yes stop_codon:yes gene_type:complete
MRKIVLLIFVASSLIFSSCDAPSVVNENIQKELNNKKVRHISHEDEELFGLIFSEELIKETFAEGVIQQKIDSVNKIKGVTLEYISSANIGNQPALIAEQLDMFNYDFERGLDLVTSGNYFSKTTPYFYYSTKAITDSGAVIGFWLLKIEPALVRRNLPEA